MTQDMQNLQEKVKENYGGTLFRRTKNAVFNETQFKS